MVLVMRSREYCILGYDFKTSAISTFLPCVGEAVVPSNRWYSPRGVNCFVFNLFCKYRRHRYRKAQMCIRDSMICNCVRTFQKAPVFIKSVTFSLLLYFPVLESELDQSGWPVNFSAKESPT